MRLLIFTQTVDRQDSILGYYHAWLTALAPHFDSLFVGALRTGTDALPHNVTLVPLRPWGYRARLRTALAVLALAWQRRHDYDAVFVHMNQEYLLVAGWLWTLLGKPMYFWRNHYEGTVLTRIAAAFCTKVFYTSRSSYTARLPRAIQMPVGVDVDSCHLDEAIERQPGSTLFLGRFDESKHPELLVEALGKLQHESQWRATFVGGPSDPHSSFPREVEEHARALGIHERCTFVGAVPNTETYRYYRSHALYVNAGKSGMLDKSLFKAIACGCLPLYASTDLAEMSGGEFAFTEGDATQLAEHLRTALALSPHEREARVHDLQQRVVEAHSLPVLAKRLAAEMTV